MALKENSKTVFNFVKAANGADITVKDIEKGTGLNARQINGIITAAFQRHKEGDVVVPLMERIPAEETNEDGTHTPVKLIKLTAAGESFDPDAE